MSGQDYFSGSLAITQNNIIFSKIDGSGQVNNTKNLVAFPVSCTSGYYWRLDQSNADYYPLGQGEITYEIAPGGEKEISCTVSGNAIAGTFGMNDESGEYKATITITSVGMIDNPGETEK